MIYNVGFHFPSFKNIMFKCVAVFLGVRLNNLIKKKALIYSER